MGKTGGKIIGRKVKNPVIIKETFQDWLPGGKGMERFLPTELGNGYSRSLKETFLPGWNDFSRRQAIFTVQTTWLALQKLDAGLTGPPNWGFPSLQWLGLNRKKGWPNRFPPGSQKGLTLGNFSRHNLGNFRKG